LFLRSLYNRLIREHFSGRPLLAIFPLEVYLTKEFEKTPFLTAVYPDSWLAKKTRTLIYDLLSKEHADKLPPPIRSMPKWMRAYAKLSLGKPSPILNINVAMPTMVAVGVFLGLLSLTLSQFFAGATKNFRKEMTAIRIFECLHESDVLKNDRATVEKIINDPDSYPKVFSDLAKEQLQRSCRYWSRLSFGFFRSSSFCQS
jgi:hypothetical protein